MKDNILTEIERIIKENEELKMKIAELEINNRNILMRERLYQSALSSAKNQMLKLAQSIDTTPHSRDAEYQHTVYGVNDNGR